MIQSSIPYFIARIPEDKDFLRLKEMAENHDGWKLDYNKTNIKVWTKHVDDSSFNMVKVWAVFSNVNCVDLYDAVQDPWYRREWDSHMIVGIDIGCLNPNTDISYYAMYCPTPLKNRDFVLQRSWLDAGSEFYIINHSVCHKDYPPKKNFVRAVSYFTGYFIKCHAVSRESNGCEMSYVTRSDPQGVIPAWLVNKCTQIFAPKYIKQVEKAALEYKAWKNNNNPQLKPWIHPEQMEMPRISVRDCVPCEEELELNPSLKAVNFEMFLPKAEEESQSSQLKKNVIEQTNVVSKKNKVRSTENNDYPSNNEGSTVDNNTGLSSTSQAVPKKSKNKFNSLLKFANICGKKSRKQ